MLRVKEKGQAMAEFALMIPALILLLFGMTFAAFYAFRSASTAWGVFITGVATGSYNTPATGQASQAVLWPDLRGRIGAGVDAAVAESPAGLEEYYARRRAVQELIDPAGLGRIRVLAQRKDVEPAELLGFQDENRI